MVVVSTRDFRANQTKYLGMAKRGEQVMLHSRRTGRFMITPVENEEEEVITPELQAAIDKARQEYREGKCLSFHSVEEIRKWMDSL
ncbi:MAG: prevent-host-death family protein [Bacteroidaceae bacterium]|nr:prevent-host-death family protein [Bacteroidaceae bacterium]